MQSRDSPADEQIGVTIAPPSSEVLAAAYIGSTTPASFADMGSRVMGSLVRFTSLSARSRVLDIGCGLGRVAIPLTSHLEPSDESTRYEGIDVAADSIAWCDQHISPRFRPRLVALPGRPSSESHCPNDAGGVLRPETCR